MGQAMTKGISDNLGVTKVSLARMRKSITDSMKDIKVEVGVDVTKVALDELKRKIGDKLKDIKIFVNVDVSKVQLDLVRAKIEDGLKGITVHIGLDVSKTSIAKTRAEIRDGLKGINANVNVNVGGGGGRAGGGAAGAAGGGFIGGINALIRALPGGTAGSIGAVPAPILAGAGAVGLAALPFIGQILAGIVPLLGGGAITGLGIAGAFGVGGTTQQQVAQARAASQAANARVRAAQARVAGLGGGGATGLATTAAQDQLAAAQARLTTARGGTSASAILSAEAAVASAQDHINKLRGTGKVSTAQLTSAEASLASARAAQAKASQAYQKAQQDQITKGQEAARASFQNLADDAKQSLSQIGAPMAPVMAHIFTVVDKTMKALTPLFTAAVQVISGPFETFADTIIKSLADPHVKSAIVSITTAFVDVMKAFTPDIPGIINSFADAIKRIADSVSKNPKAFADFLNFVFQLGILFLDMIGYLSDFAGFVETHFMPAVHAIVNFFKGIGIDPGRFWHAVIDNFKQAIGIIVDIFKLFRDIWTGNWSAAGRDIVDIGKRFWRIIVNDFKTIIPDLLKLMGYLGSHLVSIAKAAFDHLWWLILDIGDRGRHSVAHQWDQFRHDVATIATHLWHDVNKIWDRLWSDTIGSAIRQQRHLQQLITGWLHDLAHWFDVARHDVASAWNTMWDDTVGKAVRAWQWLYAHVWTPVKNFFTVTLPGWFDNAVKSVSHLWDNIKGAISAPVAWVGKHILAHLFNAIDDITNFVGLHKPLQAASNILAALPTAATGGKVTQGTGPTADDVLIRVSRGETIVSAAHSKLPIMQAAFAAAGVPGHGFPPHVPGRGDAPTDWIPGFATGGQVEQSMLNFMLSKRGSPYSEANRWGRPPWDCSSLVWDAANRAGVPIPQSQAIAASEADWFARYPGTYMYRNASQAQTGDIIWSVGAAPGPSQFGGIGHVGMAANPGTMISALGTAYGVTTSPFPSNFVVGARLGGSGAKGILSKIAGFFGGIVRTVSQILGGIGKFASVAISLASGNIPKALGDMLSKVGHGTGGAGGVFANVLSSLPGNLAHKALSFLANKVKSFVQGQQSAGGVPGVPPAHGSALAAQNFARAHLAQFGWGPGQFPPLLALWNQESGWNANAVNPSSGAYGIPQSLGHGHPYNLGDYANQVMWGLNYIRGRYGSPAAAWAHEQANNWYAKGTDGAAAGWAWVGEKGRELVHFSGGETVIPNDALFGGYQSGTVSAAAALAAQNKAAAAALAARNKAAAAAIAARNKATAAAIAAANKMANAGASLVAAIAKITPKTTASVFASDQAKFLADLRLYFTPSTAKARSQLVIKQISEMENLQTHMKSLTASIANATAYQKQELQHLQSTGGIGAIGIQGVGAAGGRSILSGLTRQLTDMRNFGYAVRDLSRAGASQAVLKTVAAMDPASGSIYARKMISALNKMHALKLSPEMINQLIALGPDAALAYANAMQAAGPSVLKQIKSTEAALASTTLGTSRGIAAVVSGGAYNTGANFVAGLKSQEKSLESQFAHLGKVLGEEAIKWMHVPSNKRPFGFQHGGWINEPVSGYGDYSGAFYTFAEKGREYVLPEGQASSNGSQGDSYHAHFDGLTRAAIESHVRTAFQAMAMQQGKLQRQGRRF